MNTLIALNGMAAGAYLSKKDYSGALIAANAAAVISRLDYASEQRELTNRLNHAILEGQQIQAEQFARFAGHIEQTMGYIATGLEALHDQGRKQGEIMVHQLSSLVSLGEKLDTQTQLMIQGNRYAEKASETRSEELLGKGLKCLSSLHHLPETEHAETADRAIRYFEAAIDEDEFNEQAQLQAAIYKCFRKRDSEEWLRHYRKAKAVALTELKNNDPVQVKIAEQVIEAIAAAAPLDMVKNGQTEVYREEFADFCLRNASPADIDNVQFLTCAAMVLAAARFETLFELAQEVAQRRGWPFLITGLMTIDGVVHSERFFELLEVVCGLMGEWERECAESARGIFQ